MSYRTVQEKHYFGSDLNKWINENCSREMTVNNIDLVMYKASKKIVRIIETKKNGEPIPYSQQTLLDIFSRVFRIVNSWKLLPDYTFEVYTIAADPPYYSATIHNLITNQRVKVDQRELKGFSEFIYDPFTREVY